MKNKWTKHLYWAIPVAILLVLVLWVIGSYNGLIKAGLGVDNQWAQVETVYQRRIDLIPNLVATVQGAANFEKDTQTQIAALRTSAITAKQKWDTATTAESKVAAADEMESVYGSFRALNINVENYPQLKATENFLAFQDELAGTENRISVERMRYNDAVKAYNTKVKVFPSNMIASLFGFEARESFKAAAGAEKAPQVSFT